MIDSIEMWCWRIFFFFFIFSQFYVGSMCLMRRLHLGRSCMSSSDNPLSDKSFLMLSNHLRFGLPLLLFPGISIPITLFPTYSSSLLETCQILLRIPWTARRTNITNQLLKTLKLPKKQKLSYFGHIMRRENSLEKLIMLGMGGGTIKRGRPRAYAG